MKASQLLSATAAVLGTVCAVFAAIVYRTAHVSAALPLSVGGFDERRFWWPLAAAIALWSLACVMFVRHKRIERNTPSD